MRIFSKTEIAGLGFALFGMIMNPSDGFAQRKIENKGFIYGASYAGSLGTKSTSQYNESYMQAIEVSLLKKVDYLDKFSDTYIGGMLVYSHYDLEMEQQRPGTPLDPCGNFIAGGLSIRQDFNMPSRLMGNIGLSSLIENGFGYQFKTKNNTDLQQTQGGHFQIFFNAGMFVNWKINKRNTLMVGPQFSHYSNSRTSSPNNGVNSLSLAVKYYYRTQEEGVPSTKGIGVGTRKWYADVATGIGLNALNRAETSGRLYASSNSSIAAMYLLNYRKSVGLGLDYFNNPSGSLDRKKQFLGVSGRYETDFGKLGINMRLGRYLNGEHAVSGHTDKCTKIYESISLRYYLTNAYNWKPYIGYQVKANDFHAEFFEIHFGVRL